MASVAPAARDVGVEPEPSQPSAAVTPDRPSVPRVTALTWQEICDSEHETLLRYLDKMREAVVRAADGLDEDQLRRPGVPSGTNLLGLVHHLTGVEEHWFQFVFAGADVTPDMGMTAPADVPAAEVLAWYRAMGRRNDDLVRSCPDLSMMAARCNPGEDDLDSLRIVTAHMIEETGRHAGHADILREQIDGRVDD